MSQTVAVALDPTTENRRHGLRHFGWFLAPRQTRPGGLEPLNAVRLNLHVDKGLDGGQLLALLWSDEGDRDAVGAEAACAPDPMNIVLRVLRQIVVDDVRDTPHVDAATDDVGGDEVNDFAVAEALHDAVAQSLIEVAVHDGGPTDMMAQVAVEVLRPALALAKDEALPWFL